MLATDRVLMHNVVVGSGTVIAGVLGIAFQSVFSHQLRPADYGGVFAVVTLITVIALPASGFTLLMARQASRDLASGQSDPSAVLLRRGNRALLLVGAFLGVGLVVASPVLSAVFNVPVQLLSAAAVGFPFGLALPLLIGEFQGEQRFLTLSGLLVAQAGLKLVGALVLGALWGPVGIIAGISVATALAYVAALALLRNKRANQPVSDWWRPSLDYLAVIIPSTLALSVLLSADVLIVKHYFADRSAGEYAAVAALGRAIFWGASGVAAVLFPKVIFRGAQGRSGSHLVRASLLLVAAGGLAGLGILSLSKTWLLNAFAGSGYAEAASYLPLYAAGMTLLGGVAVLIATHQSRGTPGFLAILLPLTLLEPAALIAFHQSLGQVVQIVDICMGLILVGLGGLYLLQERRSMPSEARLGTSATSASAQLSINR